jgi:hypothetical protein
LAELEKVELRTICCVNHDPICDHCFDLVQSIIKNEPFCPRYAHNIGYRGKNPTKDEKKRRKLRKHLPESRIFMDGWKEYTKGA